MALTLTPFASVHDVETVWGDLSVEDEAKVEGWLDTASTNLRLIGRKRGINIDQYISGDELLTEAAKNAVVASIRRVLLNPKGLRQRSVTVTDGPFSDSGSETVDTALSASEFYFSDNDLSWLPAAPRRGLRSFTIRSGFRQ